MDGLLTEVEQRLDAVAAFRSAYRYCWLVVSVDELKLAPFHLLTTEGAAHTDNPHT